MEVQTLNKEKTHKSKPKQKAITGVVEHVYFSNHKFCAGRLVDDKDKTIKFAGLAVVSLDERIKLYGSWTEHEKYGKQFETEKFEYDRPTSKKGLSYYLSKNPKFKGIGPVKADLIAENFSDDSNAFETFEKYLNEQPEKIAAVAKAPIETVKLVKLEWNRTRQFNQTITDLHAFELTHHQVTEFIEELGNNASAVLKENPYILIGKIDGFGFKRTDKIARKVRISKEKPERIRAGILYCIDEAIDRGHCWTDFEELLKQAEALLILDCLDAMNIIADEIDYLVKEGELLAVNNDREMITRPWIYNMEYELSAIFIQGFDDNPHKSSLVKNSRPVSKKAKLYEEQAIAFLSSMKHKIQLISGGAGAGKTYLSNAIKNVYKKAGLTPVFCAPTGKAAKRLEQMSKMEAFTIHRLLEYNGVEFKKGPDDPIEADVVLVDEVSMMDVPLAWRLFKAIDLNKTSVVLLGDHNQLPPVGFGNVLRDLIKSMILPTAILTQIVRQAGTLKKNSMAILDGTVPPTPQAKLTDFKPWYVVSKNSDVLSIKDFVLYLYENILSDRFNLDLMHDVQLLTPTRKGPLGVNELNIQLQMLIQKKLFNIDVNPVSEGKRPEFYVNDKIIQRKNNYQLGIMNGSIGRIISIDKKTKDITAIFDNNEVMFRAARNEGAHLQLAYALTIHQCQGSEFPAAVNIIHKSHSFMHHRNLFYTGVTRAGKSAIIIGDRWGIGNCAKKQETDRRRTFLSFFLNGLFPGKGEYNHFKYTK